jgi:poly(glycerol-phosphate) alpha-glucosyltransferase
MRVIHYTPTLSRSAGGLFASVPGLCGGLAASGVEIAVIGGADEYFATDRAAWRDLALFPHTLGRLRYGLSPTVFDMLRALRPDVLHLHGVWAASSIYGLWAARHDIPVILSPRGMLDAWILERRRAVKTVHAALFERPLLQRAYVHALTDAERDAVTRFAPISSERSFVVPNGTTIPRPHKTTTDRRGMLYLGRLHPKKQVLELIGAWGRNQSQRGQTLTIAGWGAPDYVAAVEAATRAAAGVRFVGPVYGADKSALLFGARGLILPSVSEGLPMAVLEALAHGTVPVITTACNFDALVREGVATPIEADLSDLDRAVASILDLDPPAFACRSERARMAAQRYDWIDIGRTMAGVYRTMLARGCHG